jgi:hypothetical protein
MVVLLSDENSRVYRAPTARGWVVLEIANITTFIDANNSKIYSNGDNRIWQNQTTPP